MSLLARLLGPLAHLSIKRAAGVHVMDGTVYVAIAIRTVLDYEVQGIFTAPLEGRRPGAVMAALLEQAQEQFGQMATISTGVPSNDVYFEARPMSRGATPEQYQTPEALAQILPAALSPNTLLVNLLPVNIRGTPNFLITACKRMVVYNGIQTLAEANLRAGRFEPVPWALLRQSFLHAPSVDAEQLQVRLLVGDRRCVGYLLQGELPLAWFNSALSRPDERDSVLLATIRSMENHARSQYQSTLDKVLVQGLSEDQATMLSLSCGLTIESIPGPPIDGSTVATGLALAGLDPAYPAPNLANNLQAPDTLWALLNHFEVGMIGLTLAILVVALSITATDLKRRQGILAANNEEFKPAQGKDVDALQRVLAEGRETCDAYAAFLDRRTAWAPTLAAIAEIVPPNSRLKKLSLRQPPPAAKGPTPDRELVLACLAPEERPVLANFQKHPYLAREFQSAQLTGLARTGASVMRAFTLEASGTGRVPAGAPLPSTVSTTLTWRLPALETTARPPLNLPMPGGGL